MLKFKQIYNTIVRWPGVRQFYGFRRLRNERHRNQNTMELVYKVEDLNDQYYQKIKDLGLTNLEHHIGRFTNMKRIVEECAPLKGDLIEFGTWMGFSLLWIAYFLERQGMMNRRLVGLDGFSGLPEDDGVFKKGMFGDASLRRCRNNILNNKVLYEETRKNIFIEKFFFNENEKILRFFSRHDFKQFCFIHIDCDIYQSAIDIFNLLEKGNLIADRAFILFDDYGWNSQLAPTVDRIFSQLSDRWKISEHSSTRYTKNFYFEARNKSTEA